MTPRASNETQAPVPSARTDGRPEHYLQTPRQRGIIWESTDTGTGLKPIGRGAYNEPETPIPVVITATKRAAWSHNTRRLSLCPLWAAWRSQAMG